MNTHLQSALIDALQTVGYKGIAADLKEVLPTPVLTALVGELVKAEPRPGDPAPTLTTR